MTETTTTPEASTPKATPPEARPNAAAESTPRGDIGTPVAIWLLYVLGIIAALVLAATLVFVAILYALSSGSSVSLHISVPVLALWIGLAAAAAGVFLWRRQGRRG